MFYIRTHCVHPHRVFRHKHIMAYCYVLHTHTLLYVRTIQLYTTASSLILMGWLRLVKTIKLYVSFAKEPHKRDDILHKKPRILSILLTVATPYLYSPLHLECQFFILESQSMIQFPRSLLPRSVDKRPRGFRLRLRLRLRFNDTPNAIRCAYLHKNIMSFPTHCYTY